MDIFPSSAKTLQPHLFHLCHLLFLRVFRTRLITFTQKGVGLNKVGGWGGQDE